MSILECFLSSTFFPACHLYLIILIAMSLLELLWKGNKLVSKATSDSLAGGDLIADDSSKPELNSEVKL